MIKYSKDTDHIVTLTLDMKGRQRNLLNHELVETFRPVLEHLLREKVAGNLKGVVITSAKENFLVGGDLKYLSEVESSKEIFEYSEKLKAFFRVLERPGIPVVAAINGNAIGTGFEMALACHHRVVLDSPDIRVGLPEVSYGVMPGNGGTVRLLWVLGIEKAFEILTQGRILRPNEALQAGIVDELAKDENDLINKAKQFILSSPEVRRPWDQPDALIPGGTARDPKSARLISRLAAKVKAKYRDHYPAPSAVLNVLNDGSQLDFETASRIESRYYAALLESRESANMTQAMWFDKNDISNGLSRPAGFGKFRPRKVGIIGAGMMGSGIASTCLTAGHEVILKDVSKPIAEKGKEKIELMLNDFLTSGKINESEKNSAIKRIRTTESSEEFSDCDIVIESVFENANVKKKVVAETQEYLDNFSLLASNTISIPITKLAQKSIRPEQFVGLHFFRPAHESPLVEIVRGEKTSDETIARAFDFVKAIGKTPIIVKDDWGFYVARVRNTYVLEGITMLQEGYSPALIENLGLASGMPMGPLALADELSLPLILNYEKQAAEHYGEKYTQHPAVSVLNVMLDKLNREGKNKKAGFYEYTENNKRIWPELIKHFPTTINSYQEDEIIERYLFAQILEAIWCLQEKVVSTVQEANLGSVYGWGFPAFRGGVIQYVRDYGKKNFIEESDELKKAHGGRFTVPKWLKKNEV